MKIQTHILVIRLSSLGDVALTIPVLKNIIAQNPDIKISVLSKSFHAPLFEGIENLDFISFDSNIHKGFFGILKFVRNKLFTKNFTHIIDLHDVLRTKLIRFLYSTKKITFKVFEKGREEKNNAIKNKTIQKTPLKHVSQRYADAFIAAGFNCELNDRNAKINAVCRTQYTIGIAPLSKHFTKNFPIEKMQELIEQIIVDNRFEIKILCAKGEQEQLKRLLVNERVTFLMNENNFKNELDLFKQLDLVISMDSANMHIATNYKVPVITIWGGTHPNIGFSSYYTNNINVQTDLACRPCSIYGSAVCPLRHFNCMKSLEIDAVLQQIKVILQ